MCGNHLLLCLFEEHKQEKIFSGHCSTSGVICLKTCFSLHQCLLTEPSTIYLADNIVVLSLCSFVSSLRATGTELMALTAFHSLWDYKLPSLGSLWSLQFIKQGLESSIHWGFARNEVDFISFMTLLKMAVLSSSVSLPPGSPTECCRSLCHAVFSRANCCGLWHDQRRGLPYFMLSSQVVLWGKCISSWNTGLS